MLDFKGLTMEFEPRPASGLVDLDRPDLSARAISTGRFRRLLQLAEREEQKAA